MSYDITEKRKQQGGDDDHRVRISVFLVGNDTPRYWSFHCVYCGDKLCELSGDVIQLRDVDDIQRYNKNNAPMNVRCKGRYCRMWYEFTLRD